MSLVIPDCTAIDNCKECSNTAVCTKCDDGFAVKENACAGKCFSLKLH